MSETSPQLIRLADYRPPEFLIDAVELCFELDPEHTEVSARLSIRRNPAVGQANGSLRLAGEGLELLALALDGQPLPPDAYRLDEQGLTLWQVPERFRLDSRVAIHPARNTALEGLYQSKDILCTQCEAEGFRRISFFLDRPDVLARYRTTLIADRKRFPVLLANGNPIERAELPDGRHRVTWEDPFPKPCYLFALVAGDLECVEDRFVTASEREVRLQIYVEPQKGERCAHAMQSLKQAMRWDEVRFGREYDLDVFMIVAVSHFNMGAMENKGLNLFNDRYVLASPQTATDEDFAHIAAIVAHEYFHNWTGNRITCRDWFQLSLKEGLTVYREQEFAAGLFSPSVQRIRDVRFLRAQQFPEDAGPLAHPVRPDSYLEINNFYTATVYEKGAELIRMQATLLGPESFRRGMDLYFARHDGQAVTIEDFVRCMEEASGRDLGQFRRWYEQAGTPELSIWGGYDPTAQTYTLHVRQFIPPTPGQLVKHPLHLPLAIGLLGEDGRELPVWLAGEPEPPAAGTRVLEVTESEQHFVFVGLDARPVPSLLRGFSAPVKLKDDLTESDRLFLLAHDPDGFGRWEAGQGLMQDLLLRLVADPKASLPAEFIEAFRHALRAKADPALIAEVLTPPSEEELGEQMAVIDVEGIHRAHRLFGTELGRHLREDWIAVYRDNAEADPSVLTPEAVGRRALNNLALAYLMRAGNPEGLELCRMQFGKGRNLTDVLAALRLLVERGGDDAEAALAEFYRRWSHEPLVIDKWFAVQATAPHRETLVRVVTLLHHPAYDPGNPNRVRSLIGAFAAHNPICFHAADGAGYCLLADQVLQLEPLNPQLAARLLKPLIRWRRFDPQRQALMRAELVRISKQGARSPDVFELVSKACS
ncbi:aminopeptidase N [Caldichromatium japonicum]|uniref:Aminopeptidase N n=1 Tax=Caldichromatium japonicum TaxID=2699430 RepID=A0A6G7V9W7_9GAMM|nr:aminopeptidase N [Caldichromatium japonicum]QIK36863.1 aminopeptidase N [Caldichromatium japonicum]